MTEEFRAEKLGDLLRPLAKTYSSLIAHVVAPSRPDVQLMGEIYAALEGQKGRQSFEKHMRWIFKERINIFNPKIFDERGNFVEVPPAYFGAFVKEFNLGNLKWPVNFEHSRLLLKDYKKKIKEKIIRLNVMPLEDTVDEDGELRQHGIAYFHPAPATYKMISQREMAILAHLKFKSGALLHAKLTPNDLNFKVAMEYARIGDYEWKMPVEYSLLIHSKGLLTWATDYVSHNRSVRVSRESIQSELANYLTRNDKKMRIISEIANALKQLERHKFLVSISYEPPAFPGQKGHLILSGHFTPVISKYRKTKLNEKLKNKPLEWVYGERIAGFLQPVVMALADQILTELNPDIFFEHFRERGLFGTERGWFAQK